MRWVGILGLVTACGGAMDSGLLDGSPGEDSGADATVKPEAGTDATTIDAPSADACSSSPQCSADFHSIVDCHGAPLQTCAPDQGCTGATCVPACSAMLDPQVHHWQGCEFYSVVPDVLPNNNLEGGCYAVAVTNAWTAAMTVTVDFNGSNLSGSFMYTPTGTGPSMTFTPVTQVQPGATALLFLAQAANAKPACPSGVTPALTIDPATHGTAIGSAFHITTSMPAGAADFVPFGASAYIASASVLLPTQQWGTSNVVVDGYVASQIAGGVPSTDIVALQDNTTVTILPVANIVGSNTVAAATANQPQTYKLSKGQVLQLTQKADLSGSPLASNNPIGVWGAHTCMNIDPSTGYCDSGHQQIAPIMFGWDYAGVRYRNRTTTDETPPWRVVGQVKGTQLTWDPPVSGAPSTIDFGQVATFTAAGPFRVHSQDPQHPFYVSAHMTGGAPFNMIGDPEFVNVVPVERWRGAYTFFTQPGFPETSVVVVRSSAQGGFKDVKLDCAGTLAGWAPIDSAGLYEYTRLDLSIGSFSGQNGCDNGVHTATSDAPFTLTTWGWGNSQTSTMAVSYALPAGM